METISLRKRTQDLLVVLLALATLGIAASMVHAADLLLGIPLPTNPSLQDLLSTHNNTGDGQGVVPGAGACNSAAHRPISLPTDDRPHNDQYVEFWWWYGHLITKDGQRFAFLLWFASKPWARVYWADYTLEDLSTGTFHYGREPLIPGRPASRLEGVQLSAEHASAAAGDGHDRLAFTVDGYALRLSLTASRPPTVALDHGYAQLYCNSTYLYGRDRMRITGTLARDGTTGSITGTSNFLHGWGFLPLLDAVTYNTFSFSLPDGRDIWLLYFHVGGVGSLRVGSISDPEGHITVLHPSDWRAVPTGTWQRDSTCTYPVDWNVTVKGMHFQARPSLLNPELRATRSPQIYALWPEWPNYWSGETVFTGDAAGRGWLEDGGYCRT